MIQRIVIVGAGRTSASLLDRLSRHAPITLLDRAASALEELPPPSTPPRVEAEPEDGAGGDDLAAEQGADPIRHAVTRMVADGTSRLVLEDLRGSEQGVALVAATGDDRVNLEVCRLGADLRYNPMVAIVIDPREAHRYAALGARTIVRATLLGDVVERALLHDGVAVASNLGLGRGDIVEITILQSSPVVGQQLGKLDTEGWKVAAVYRGDSIILPRRTTTFAADDRVLLVGEPDVLPYVAENLRTGVPNFPVRHGPNVAVYLPGGRDRAVECEAEVLTLKTRAAGLIRLYPGAMPTRTLVEETFEETVVPVGQRQKWFDDAPLDGIDLEEHARTILSKRPGLVVLAPEARPLWQRILGIQGRDAALCNLLPVPLLFHRGRPHYERVVHLVAREAADPRAAAASIDVARLLGLPFIIARVNLPSYFGPADPQVGQTVEALERRARQCGLAPTTVCFEGNPVAEAIRYTSAADLIVVSRSRTRRDSFTSPDVAVRIAAGASCSTLVWTE